MTYCSNILLGQILKVSGYEGAVSVKLDQSFIENIPEMESLFLEIEGRQVPFFVSDLEYRGAELLRLRFEGYDTIDKIREFTGCRVFLTTSVHYDKPGDDVESLEGYKVIHDDRLLGTVKEVIQNPGQWLLNVKSTEGRDILIPVHEHLIVDIDNAKNTIVIDIPEGLTEIN